jgi:hypothetical protein
VLDRTATQRAAAVLPSTRGTDTTGRGFLRWVPRLPFFPTEPTSVRWVLSLRVLRSFQVSRGCGCPRPMRTHSPQP